MALMKENKKLKEEMEDIKSKMIEAAKEYDMLHKKRNNSEEVGMIKLENTKLKNHLDKVSSEKKLLTEELDQKRY